MSRKKIFSTLLHWKFTLLSSSVLLVIGASAQAETVTLGFNCLPSSQGWTYSGTLAENTMFAADGSSLVQTTLGTGSSSARYALINNGILDSSKPITLSLTARVLDHEFVTFGSTGLGFNFIIRDDVFQHRVGMTSSMLQVDNVFIPLDTTTFHDYVFELSPGGGSKLFVDGELLASGEVPAMGLSKLLLFGDSTIHENANVDITALSITVGAVGKPLDLLIGDVENLADCGILSGGQANSLIVKANVTIARLDSGNTTAACNELQAFINAVGALVRAGTLTPDEGQSLIVTANSISVENGC